MNRVSPYQTITTKVIPCTNTRPTRIKATCDAGSVTLSYNYGGYEHEHAVRMLCEKLNWDYRNYYGGQTKDGVVWVRVEAV